MNTAASQGQLFAVGSSRKYRTAPSDKNQQFSPRWIADFARTVFGGPIFLDPASSNIANESIASEKIYTIDDDALIQSWETDTLFFNPPYGAGLIAPMVTKFLEELPGIGQAIVLVNSSTCARWYQALLQGCNRFLLPRQRINFWTAEGCPEHEGRIEYQTNPPGGNRFDQTLFYFGANVRAFEEYGRAIGTVSAPIRETFSVGQSNNLQKEIEPRPQGDLDFCRSIKQPTERKSVTLSLQLIDSLSGEIEVLKSQGVAGPTQYLNEQAKGNRVYYLLRWVEKSRVRAKSPKPSDVAEVRGQIARRNEVQSLECRISEIHKIIQKLEAKH